jgi:peptidoglycan-associated lipoprotein
MNTRYIGALAILALALLAGCASTPQEQEGAAVEDRSKPLGPEAMRPKPTPTPDAGGKPLVGSSVGAAALKDPGNILSKRSIFFDLDSNLVKEEYKPIVAAHARYLQENRGAKMRVEGNADERGSREYNIALGQRRADAVRQMMQLLGAQASQIETVSFGEEKPRCTGNDEACWQQNRRGDIVYQGE